MTELVSGSASISNLYANIGEFASSPVRIAKATYDFLDEVLNNQVDIVDPTNPFVLLLEVSSIQTAAAINESLLNVRRSYVGLSQTDDDIYRHLTDSEFIGRFATPGYGPYTFMIQLDTLFKAMVFDPIENCKKGILPRDSFITIDGYVFTLEYPITFRQYSNGVLQITYDTSIKSPISSPSNNIISFKVRQDANGLQWLYFNIPVKQMQISSTSTALQGSSIFRKDIPFTDEFVYARVFQKSDSTGSNWSELYTTHSDQVFDNATPTAVLKVTSNTLNVTIPFIYNTLKTISGKIRIDIYTTKGKLSLNLGSYSLKQYVVTLRNIDDIRDTNPYSTIWSNVTLVAFSTELTSPGVNSVSFDTLRKKVTDYAFGNFNVPITNAQLDTVSELNNFTIIRNADALTERYFLGIRPIPATNAVNSSQKELSRANVGMIRYSATIAELKASDNIVDNNKRFTMLSGTLFKLDNGLTSIVEQAEVGNIKALPVSQLVNTVNANKFVYTPYYYVFDIQQELLNVRPYDLDHPDAANLSFVSQNTTLALVVNTGPYSIQKTNSGFKLMIQTISGSAYKQLNDGQVSVQLRFVNKDGSLVGTINGVQIATDPITQERIYSFDINTTYDVDDTNSIELINCYNTEGIIPNFYVPLDSVIDIIYTTTSVTNDFINDISDTLINKAQLPNGSVGNSHDTLEIFFGEYLEHLWARVRSYASGNDYQVSPVDVPAYYTQDVYQIDPVTNSMLFFDAQNGPLYNKLHSVGDPVLDEMGQQTYLYRAGDPITDLSGNPIIITSVTAKNEFDILVVDGKLAFVTDPDYVVYRNNVVDIITGWITKDILEVQARLIERTEIFFYPQACLGLTEIIINGKQNVFIDSEQKLVVNVFIDNSIAADLQVQNNLASLISNYLDEAITQKKFTINQIEYDLRNLIGNNVFGITINGLGGDADYKSMNISDQHNRLCVGRKVIANTDNSITVIPDITINFNSY